MPQWLQDAKQRRKTWRAQNVSCTTGSCAEGEGAAKIQWGVPGDFDRCLVELSKYVSPSIVKGLCSNLHQRATGARPGHAPSEQTGGH